MAEMVITKIEQIKMLRFGTKPMMGLVEAKCAVECFERAQGLRDNCIKDMQELFNFTKFILLVQSGVIEANPERGQMFPTLPKALTDQELYAMIKAI